MSEPVPPSAPEPPSAPVPPAPPAPPAPPVPPVPRYGEYAPAGYVPPVQQPGPYDAPHPDYGQPFGAASYPAQPGTRKRKTWDVVLTSILLALGLIGTIAALAYAALFSSPELLDQAFQQQGLDGFNGTVGAAPAIMIGSHVVLYLIALGGAIPLLITKRIAFWVPLVTGVIAAIFFWASIAAVFLSDPNFVATYS